MATDDKFAQITALLALTITFGLFMASHWSSIFTQRSSETVAADLQIPQTPPSEAVSENTCTASEAIVHATHEIEKPVAHSAARAALKVSGPKASSDSSASKILQSLASGWKDAPLPPASEILVRKDRDGRIVVAGGTHRRYGVLLRDLENLDPEDIRSVLALERTSSGNSLRDQLMRRIDEILAFDLPDVEPDMQAGKVAWNFADESFRKLGTPERDLLLMGRSNAEAMKSTLAEIRELLVEDVGGLQVSTQHELIASADHSDDETVIAP